MTASPEERTKALELMNAELEKLIELQFTVGNRIDTKATLILGFVGIAVQYLHAEAWLRVVRELARLADTLQRLAAARSELRVEADLADAARTELRTAHAGLRAEWPAHLQPDEATTPYEAKGMSDRPRSGHTLGRSVENTGVERRVV